jgi:hypothetical protein
MMASFTGVDHDEAIELTIASIPPGPPPTATCAATVTAAATSTTAIE